MNKRLLDTEQISEIETYSKGRIDHLEHENLFHTLWHYKSLVESQKEEIEKFKHRDRVVSLASETLGRYVNEGKEEIKVLKRRLERLAETSVDISEHESLKAITELAVKGLKSIADHTGPKTGEDAWEMFQEAEYTLSEIERLFHEHNS